MDTGKALGNLKGLIYKNNKVTFLYCKFPDKYVYIPINDVYIGSDAIMLKANKNLNMLHTDVATKVYDENGKEIGTVTSIEMDDFFHITGIIMDDLFIEIDKILHMDNIIIIKTNKKDIEASGTKSINPIVHINVPDKSDNQDEEQETNTINYKLNIESGPDSMEQLPDNPEEIVEAMENIRENEVQPKTNEDEIATEIDPRYNHLCGKKLLENITIVKETYKKGTLIDESLIQFAINNNAIVKVIMNTED